MFMSAIKPAERSGGKMPPACGEELGIYAYVGNDPVNFVDRDGKHGPMLGSPSQSCRRRGARCGLRIKLQRL
jgi:hypothetical protein